jgi:tetratricopeptide (TPR) repeat protein
MILEQYQNFPPSRYMGSKNKIIEHLYNTFKEINFKSAVVQTLAYEEKAGTKLYSDDIKESLSFVKPILSQTAFQLNGMSKFSEASEMFYSIYELDKNDGNFLENAAITAYQSGNYKKSEQLYLELLNSEYVTKGVKYYAVDTKTGKEEVMPSKEYRTKMISLKAYEKPRDEKNIEKLPEIYKALANSSVQLSDFSNAKKYLHEARKLNPKDEELLNAEFSLHFNEAYNLIKQEQKIVDEINNNLKNKVKYDELMTQRKDLFKLALPSLEKAFEIKPNDVNTKALLRISYEILEMNDKASKL